MLLEIIIAFLIVAISLGIIFQNLSVSMSFLAKGKSKLEKAFFLETVGARILLGDKNLELPNVVLKSVDVDHQGRDYQLIEVQGPKNSLLLFLKKEQYAF